MPFVLITGASKGIGLATTERLAQKGDTVYAAVRSPEQANELQALAAQYPNIKIIQLDVTESETIIQEKIAHLPIDILINNAGIGLVGSAESATAAESQHIFDVNYFGVQKIINAVLPGMRKRNNGKIINLSSVVGPLPDPYLPDYSASKAALESRTAVLRKNLKDADYNITVSNVQPGPVLTPFEESTPVGTRFSSKEMPYRQAEADIAIWRNLMRDYGRPVSETVDTIERVINNKNPDYWNQTNQAVTDEFLKVYRDTSGNTYMAGLTKPKNTTFKDKVANTGMYVFLCKVRVLLFPNTYIREPGDKFIKHQTIRPHGIVLKDNILLGMVELLVKTYGTEFRDLEQKYFGNTHLHNFYHSADPHAEQTQQGPAVMDEEQFLTILSREKFFRKQTSTLIKEQGVTQILILGSGLDTFAIRKAKYPARFFEVDRAEALSFKKELVEQLAKSNSKFEHISCNAEYITSNYLDPDYFDQLCARGFDITKPTLVVWGGNTMYLTKGQITQVITDLKEQFLGQAPLYVSFDYLHPDSVKMDLAKIADEKHNDHLIEHMLQGMKDAFGISFKAGFSPEELPKFFEGLGYTLWQNTNITAGDHVKKIGIENNPRYTEDYYSYATIKLS